MKNIYFMRWAKSIPLKMTLKMKLTTLLLLVSLFKINASTYSQNTKISINHNLAAIGEVFKEIESKSEFRFLYKNKEIDLKRTVSIHLDKANIYTILNNLFKETDIKYEVMDNRQIILSSGSPKIQEIENKNSIPVKDVIQQFTANGTIIDTDGFPLAAANILEKGSTNGTQADFDGNFSINVKDENATLVVSYIGFATKEVPINGQNNLNIVLEESASGLDEVVVVGYGTQKVTNLTGAVDVIDSDLIQNRPSPTVSQLLQGTSPGLSFSVGNFGFEPGASLGIQIRGLGSINGGGSPYIVIDGIPGDLNTINPEDVESISVLKMQLLPLYMAQGHLME